ncbi:uncharacterized protein F5891DRAFT_988745 [Suillus fuscotomentosus]|uniref:Uncharacterized protein n=1 Tax=Suillus fuscotomentosus TaxID=1912939 RepID=A0AAD4DNS7_9AGAM|nr:uncharacterized protein F5891DRAFT_988745 [Suillus fuscotomentosus]KAG1886847.1 hypothetical protein F5891DRAFT_988745 [Suillus fuscotomentosus]
MVIDIIQLEDGLVKYRNTFPGGPAAFFADYTQETYVAKTAVILVQTLLADRIVLQVWLPSYSKCWTMGHGVHYLYFYNQFVQLRITGVPDLDDRTEYLYSSHQERYKAYREGARGCCCFILCDHLFRDNMFCPLTMAHMPWETSWCYQLCGRKLAQSSESASVLLRSTIRHDVVDWLVTVQKAPTDAPPHD